MSEKLTWGKRLKLLREARHMTQEELASASLVNGKQEITREYIASAETDGIGSPGVEKITALANGLQLGVGLLTQNLFGDTPIVLLQTAVGKPKIESNIEGGLNPTFKIPIIGSVPAGNLDFREEHFSGYLNIARSELRGVSSEDGIYAVKVDGESLGPDGIHDNANIIFDINKKEIVNGRIYILRMPGGQFVAKHVERVDGKLRMFSSNPDFPDLEPAPAELVEILGRALSGGKYHEL